MKTILLVLFVLTLAGCGGMRAAVTQPGVGFHPVGAVRGHR